jgi:RNA polymerase sigma-70 factor (ECF subfamily)
VGEQPVLVGEWTGREDVAAALRQGMNTRGRWRLPPITANGELGAAGYVLRPGDTAYRPFMLAVLHIEQGALREISAFEQPSMFAAFGLPDSLPIG